MIFLVWLADCVAVCQCLLQFLVHDCVRICMIVSSSSSWFITVCVVEQCGLVGLDLEFYVGNFVSHEFCVCS